MFLWDYFASFFKDDSESLDPQRSEQDHNKNNEDVDMYTNATHKLKLFAFLSKKERADFNAIDSSGWSPILRAIEIDNVEILKLLIQKSKGTDLNVPSNRQHTPLHNEELVEKTSVSESLQNQNIESFLIISKGNNLNLGYSSSQNKIFAYTSQIFGNFTV